eukprot:scaffold41322_cov60-Phaeocystis_antarctica.AAC.3
MLARTYRIPYDARGRSTRAPAGARWTRRISLSLSLPRAPPAAARASYERGRDLGRLLGQAFAPEDKTECMSCGVGWLSLPYFALSLAFSSSVK